MHAILSLLLSALTACGSPPGGSTDSVQAPVPLGPAREPPVPEPPSFSATGGPALPANMRWIVPPAPEWVVTRAVADGDRLLAVADGRTLVLQDPGNTTAPRVADRTGTDGAWTSSDQEMPARATTRDVRILDDGRVERVADGHVFDSPGYVPARAWLDSFGNPIVAGAAGRIRFTARGAARPTEPRPDAVMIWRSRRGALVHDSPADGMRRYFTQPLPPGWQPVTGAVPREVVAAIDGSAFTPPIGRNGAVLLVGRAGEVSVVSPGGYERDYAEATVIVPNPRALRLIPLRDGALLRVTADAIARVDETGIHELVITDVVARALRNEATRPEHDRILSGAALDDGSAVLVLRSRDDTATPIAVGVRVDAERVQPLQPPPSEIRDVVPETPPEGRPATAILLATSGAVLRVRGTDVAPVPIEGIDLLHAFAAFRDAEGRVRVLAPRAVGCVDGDRVVACDHPARLDERSVHPLDDGLVVEDQHIDTWRVDGRGLALIEPQPLLPGIRRPLFAGVAHDLVVLVNAAQVDRSVRSSPRESSVSFEDAGRFEHVTLPAGYDPQAIARTVDGRALVGLRGGAVIAVTPPG